MTDPASDTESKPPIVLWLSEEEARRVQCALARYPVPVAVRELRARLAEALGERLEVERR